MDHRSIVALVHAEPTAGRADAQMVVAFAEGDVVGPGKRGIEHIVPRAEIRLDRRPGLLIRRRAARRVRRQGGGALDTVDAVAGAEPAGVILDGASLPARRASGSFPPPSRHSAWLKTVDAPRMDKRG